MATNQNAASSNSAQAAAQSLEQYAKNVCEVLEKLKAKVTGQSATDVQDITFDIESYITRVQAVNAQLTEAQS
jgi:hypothetical protein